MNHQRHSMAPILHLATAVLIASVLNLKGTSSEASVAAAKITTSLTVEHLKNGSYQIPDLSCGYHAVKLVAGKGHNEDGDVVFGRAAFGDLNNDGQIDAIVHLAFRTPESPWMQQLIFVLNRGGKLIQVADYSLDDSLELKALGIKSGEAVADYTSRGSVSPSRRKMLEKTMKFRLACDKACNIQLKASEWQVDPTTGELSPCVDLAPYILTIQERIGNCWKPTNKDRCEPAAISFRIDRSGRIARVKVEKSSENESADQSALSAVYNAAPLQPLPEGTGNYVDILLEFQGSVSCKAQRTGQ